MPLYIQLTEILKERIEAGEWEPGQRFASEREIREEFGVSRTVVRPALTILENDGQLARVKGRGIFLAPTKIFCRPRGLMRTLLGAEDRDMGFRVIDAGRVHPDPRLARILQIEGRRQVAHVMSVVSFRDQPIGIRDSFVSVADVSQVLDAIRAFQERGATRASFRLTLDRSHIGIETSFASPFEADLLGVSAGTPTFLIRCLELGRVRSGGRVRPVEFARMVFRADIVGFDVELFSA